MSELLDQLRKKYSGLEDYSDAEFAEAIRRTDPEFNEYSTGEFQAALGIDDSALGAYAKAWGSTPEDAAEEESNQFVKGLKSGVDQTQGLLYGAVAAAGSAAGSDAIQKIGMEGYERNMAEAAENPGRVERIEDIDSLGKFGDWAAYQLGNLTPTMATMFLTGGIGGVVAKKAAQKGVEKFVANKVTNSVSRAGIDKLKQKAINKAVPIGQGAGAMAGSTGLETGGIYAEVLEATGEDRPGVALAFGTMAGALDAVVPVRIMGKLGLGREAKQKIAENVVKDKLFPRILKEAGKQGSFEGLTEAAQTVIEKAAIKYVDENKDIFTPENLSEIYNAAAAGTLMGTSMGSVTGAFQKQPQEKPESQKDTLDHIEEKIIDDIEEMGGGDVAESVAQIDQSEDPRIYNESVDSQVDMLSETNQMAETLSKPAESEQQLAAESKPSQETVKSEDFEATIEKSGKNLLIGGKRGAILSELKKSDIPHKFDIRSGKMRVPAQHQADVEALLGITTDEVSAAVEIKREAAPRKAEATSTRHKTNEHGVYDKASGETVSYELKKAKAAVTLLNIGKDRWISAASQNYSQGNGFGHSSPLSIQSTVFGSQQEALNAGLKEIISAANNEVIDNSGSIAPQVKAAKEIIEWAESELVGENATPAEHITEEVDKAAASPNNDKSPPSIRQINANNYAKGHPVVQGIKISIENPAGSKRKPMWPTMKAHYGDLLGTVGADNDPLDVFIKPDVDIPADAPVFIINQYVKGKFDETKIIMGAENEAEARKLYQDSYTKQWKGLESIHELTIDEFNDWLKNGDTKAEYKPDERNSQKQPISVVDTDSVETGSKSVEADTQGNNQPKKESSQGFFERVLREKREQADEALSVTDKEFEKILDAFAAQELASEKPVRAVKLPDGREVVVVQVDFGKGRNLKAYTIKPLDEYKGKTYSRSELMQKWDDEIQRGDDHGLIVERKGKAYKGKKYVLDSEIYVDVESVAKTTSKAPEIPESAKSGASGVVETTKPEPTTEEINKGLSESEIGKRGKAQMKAKQDEADALAILNAANVTGKDRLDVIDKFRDGKYSLSDLKEAYPADNVDKKGDKVANEKDKVSEYNVSYEIPDESGTGRDKGIGEPGDVSAPDPVPGQVDLFTNSEENQEKTSQQFRDKSLRKVSNVRTGTFYSGVTKVSSAEDAAHILAPLRKYPVEQFMVLVLDENKKPLTVLRLSIGTTDGASVYPKDVVGAIHSVEGAKYYYMSHNHPSGEPTPSNADRAITKKITRVTSGTGVEFLGHVITGRGSNAWVFDGNDESRQLKITPAARKNEIPVEEGKFTRNLPSDLSPLTSPDETRKFISSNFLKKGAMEEGVMWLDNRNNLVDFTPMSAKEMRKLRTGKVGTGASKVIQASRNSGASAMIILVDGNAAKSGEHQKAVDNITALASSIDIRALDAFFPDKGTGAITSLAERGMMDTSKEVFYSRQSEVGNNVPKGVPLKRVQQIVNEFKNHYKGSQKLNFVVRATQVDAFGISSLTKGRLKGGLYRDGSGRVLLIAENMESDMDVLKTLRHEVVAHYGLPALLGEAKYHGLLDEVLAARDTTLSTLFDEVMEDYLDVNNYTLAEEVLARASEKNMRTPLIKRILAAIAKLLRKIGLYKGPVSLSEVEALLYESAKNLRQEDQGISYPAGGLEPVSSVAAAPMFYSQMKKVLADKLPGKGTGTSYLKAIKAYAKKGDFKAEEYEWLGIEEWLKDNAVKKMTKADVLDFMAANQIEVTEVEKGGEGGRGTMAEIERIKTSLRMSGIFPIVDGEGYVSGIDTRGANDGNALFVSADDENGLFPDYDDFHGGVQDAHLDTDLLKEILAVNGIKSNEVIERDISDLFEAVQEARVNENMGYNDPDLTQFENYTLPGGKNYTELLLTLPAAKLIKKQMNFDEASLAFINQYAVEIVNASDETFVKNVTDLAGLMEFEPKPEHKTIKFKYYRYEVPDDSKDYKGGHYTEPNILAHIRFNERTDADGKRGLFIEEVQSDWHQEGRKKGYKSKNITQDYAKKLFKISDSDWESMSDEEKNSYVDEINEGGEHLKGLIPNAPFKTTWPLLTMKRMIRYASENGFDSVAWTTGEQQADRYDLSKQVDHISYPVNKKTKKFEGFPVEITIYPTEYRSRIKKTANNESELSDIVGKDIAEKIVNSGGGYKIAGGRVIEGIDLKVGGEGMISFYDSMLPKMVNKYVKKWGGKTSTAKIVTQEAEGTRPGPDGDVDVQEITESVHALTITPQMKEAAMAGQPLFNQKGQKQTDTPAFKKWFGDSRVVDENGEPLVVYHGAASDFDVFKGDAVAGYFASDTFTANQYATDSEGAAVYPSYVSIKTPYYPEKLKGQWNVDTLKAEGYDGVIISKRDNSKVVVPFFSQQIKSATGNRGTFDAGDSSILHSRSAGEAVADMRDRSEVVDGFIDSFENLSSVAKQQRWGLLTMRQVASVIKKHLPSLIEKFVPEVQSMEITKNTWKDKAGALAERRRKMGKSKSEALSKMQHEATIAGVDPDGGYMESTNISAANDMIKVKQAQMMGLAGDTQARASIRQEIKQLKVSIGKENNRKKDYPRLKKMWNALDKNQKEQYLGERDFHVTMFDAQQKALEQRIFDSIEDEHVKRGLLDDLKRQFEANQVEKPYFPLARFGDYFVYAKGADGELTFDMFTSEAAKRRFITEIENKDGKVLGHGLNLKDYNKIAEIDTGFLINVDDKLKELGNHPAVLEIRDGIYQMYLQTLPSMSSRKAQIHRKKTKGYHRDQLKGFADAAQHGSNTLGRLKHGHLLKAELDSAQEVIDLASSNSRLEALREEIAGLEESAEGDTITERKIAALTEKLERAETVNKNDKVDYLAPAISELRASYDAMMNPRTSELSSTANAFGFTWFLGASISSAVVNMFQTPVVAMPLIAAKFGHKVAARHMIGAYKAFVKGKWTIEDQLSDDELQAYKFWHDTGLLTTTLAHDLAGISEEGIDTGTFKNKFMNTVSFMFHRAEILNREVTALATYRAAKEAGKSNQEAMEIAEELTWNSHFDYSSGNRARFMRGNAARIIFQFKQYSQQISYLYAKTIHDAFRGESAEVKKEARRALYGMLAGQMVVAGGLGIPMSAIAIGITQALVDGFGDDEDPVEVEAEIRAFLADALGEKGGKLLSKGFVDAYTPFSVSGRLSLSDLWIRTSDMDLEGRTHSYDLMKALLGPQASIFEGLVVGSDLMRQGEWQRGVEYMLPKAIKDVAKAARYGSEGALTMSGRKLKDMGPFEALAQATGFANSDLSDIYSENTAIRNVTKRRRRRRNDLIDKLIEASKNRDMKGIAQARKAIKKWNGAKTGTRISSESIKSRRSGLKRRGKETTHGIYVGKGDRDLLDRYDYAE